MQSVEEFRPEGTLLGVDSIYNYWKPTWASNRPPQFVKELFLTEADSSMLMVSRYTIIGGAAERPVGRGACHVVRPREHIGREAALAEVVTAMYQVVTPLRVAREYLPSATRHSFAGHLPKHLLL